MSSTTWSNVAIEVAITPSYSGTVQSISKANPGVVGYTATDPVEGVVAVITGTGMPQVLGRAFRVDDVVGASNTFELEGEDTSSYGTFSSGAVDFYNDAAFKELSTIVNVNVNGGDPQFANTTTVHVKTGTQKPTVSAPLVMAFDSLFDPSDLALLDLIKATKSGDTAVFRFTFENGAVVIACGYPTCTGAPTGTAQDNVTTPVTFNVIGLPCVFAS